MGLFDGIVDFFVGSSTASSGLSSLATTMNNVSAIASPFITGYSMYSSYKATEAQQASDTAYFQDSLRAALTNADWQAADIDYNYLVNSTYNSSIKDNAINNIWDSYNNQADYKNNTTDLRAILNTEIASLDLAKLKEQSLSQLKLTAEKARIDMEYTIAMAQAAADYNMSKAVIDSVNYYKQAEAAVQFLDRDIDVIQEDIRRTSEALDVEASSVVGKVLNSVSNTLTAGNSVARRVMDTYMKSDMIKQQKVSELESGLIKAYATQDRTATEVGSAIQTTLNNAVAQNIKLQQDAAAQLASIINNRNATLDSIRENAATLAAYITDSTAANNEYLYSSTTADLDYAFNASTDEVSSILDRYDAQAQIDRETADFNKYQVIRGKVETFRTMINDGSTNAEGVERYINFLNSSEGSFYQSMQEMLGVTPESLLTERQIEDYYVGSQVLGQTVPQSLVSQIDTNRLDILNGRASEFSSAFNEAAVSSGISDYASFSGSMNNLEGGLNTLSTGLSIASMGATAAGLLGSTSALSLGAKIGSLSTPTAIATAAVSAFNSFNSYNNLQNVANPEMGLIDKISGWINYEVSEIGNNISDMFNGTDQFGTEGDIDRETAESNYGGWAQTPEMQEADNPGWNGGSEGSGDLGGGVSAGVGDQGGMSEGNDGGYF